MNQRNILIILLVSFLSICICPLAVVLLLFLANSLDSSDFSESLTLLFLSALCIVPVIIAFAALGWQLLHILRAPKAARRLAGEINLRPLNEAPKEMAVWYGGEHAKREIAIKPVGSTYRYYAMERGRTGVRYYLRLVMAVRLDHPLGLDIVRPHSGASRNPQNFEEAFMMEDGRALSPAIKEAMFQFIEKGYPTGIKGVTLRLSKGLRNLRLIDRRAALPDLIAAGVLPGAAVILVHDYPDTTIGKEPLLDLLDDLAQVAKVIEDQAGEGDPNKTMISKLP